MQVAQLRAPSCGAAMPSVTSRRAAAPRAALLGRAAAAAARGPAAAARAPLAPPRAVRTDADVGAADAATLQLIADVSNAADAAHAAALARAAFDPASAPVYGEDTPLRRKVLTSIADLQAGLLERETEVRLMLLAALCGEHLLLLGPPGTAKSELSRRLAGLTRGRYFERLLTRFSVPEELFGPLSMRGLENDEYVRQTDGYLPTAEVAFVDEIFKANSAILNALLTLLNERLFDNGNARLEVPLLCLVGASNELPESEELDALYDRFLLRRQVAQVSAGSLGTLARLAAGALDASDVLSSDAGVKAAMAANVGGGSEPVGDLQMADFRACAAAAHAAVEVPDAVVDVLVGTRAYLQDKCEPPVYVSDRRFMKAVRLLQVAAHADGRAAVSEADCLLLEFVLGQRPDDAAKVRAHVLDTVASDPGLQQAELVFLGLFGRAARLLEAGTGGADLEEARGECAALVELLELRAGALAAALDGDFPELRRCCWLSEAAAGAAAQALGPQMAESRRRCEELLREGLLLAEALARPVPAGALERLLPKRAKQYAKGVAGRV